MAIFTLDNSIKVYHQVKEGFNFIMGTSILDKLNQINLMEKVFYQQAFIFIMDNLEMELKMD